MKRFKNNTFRKCLPVNKTIDFAMRNINNNNNNRVDGDGKDGCCGGNCNCDCK